MNESYTRRIGFDGAVNFRDIGGYPDVGGRRVRWRRVFRSDSLSALTDEDQRRLAALGVRTVVDFRVDSERRALPNRLGTRSAIATVEIGFMAEGVLDMLHAVAAGTTSVDAVEDAFVVQYRRFVTDHATEFAGALAIAGDERRLPLVMHCTSGKDRTGFAVCVLLLALGTPQEVILDDYALTNAHMRDISVFFRPSSPPELIERVKTAQLRYVHAAFDQMRTSFGSIDAYLARALGCDDAQRSRLVELLTVV